MRTRLRSIAVCVGFFLIATSAPAIAAGQAFPGAADAGPAAIGGAEPTTAESAQAWTAIAGVFATIGEPAWSALAQGAAAVNLSAAGAQSAQNGSLGATSGDGVPKTKESAKAKSAVPYDSAEARLGTFNKSGFTPQNVVAPYADRPPVNLAQAKVDENGVAIYVDRSTGAREDHPVVYAQYGLSAMVEYQRTGAAQWLDRAKVNAEQLIKIHTEKNGAWWFPYQFNWTYYQRTLTAPWWSGMAQGEALSLFTRISQVDPDKKWSAAAKATFESLLQSRVAGQPWSSIVIDGDLWFEEYAGNQPPLLVLNGHAFAIFGVYDYAVATKDSRAVELFDGAATTILRNMHRFEVPGGVSYYCGQAGYCQSPLWQNKTYHPIHIWQLQTLARVTGDSRFGDWARKLQADWTPAAAS